MPERESYSLEELKQERLWANWKACMKDGKKTKVPIAAEGGRTGSDEGHAHTWVTFEEALAAVPDNLANGVNFKVPEWMYFLDIDGRAMEDPLVQTLLMRFNSYAEVSPSGEGFHILGYCDPEKLPLVYEETACRYKLDKAFYMKNPVNGIELYCGAYTNRLATFTGNTINDLDFTDGTTAILTTLDKDMRKKPRSNFSLKRDGNREVFDIVADMRKQKNAENFADLYDRGDISKHKSASEADAALATMFAFRIGDDPEMIYECIKTSALMREKWERDDYREATIRFAIDSLQGQFCRSAMPHPYFVKFDAKSHAPYISIPLLARYVRENISYILVRDSVTPLIRARPTQSSAGDRPPCLPKVLS